MRLLHGKTYAIGTKHAAGTEPGDGYREDEVHPRAEPQFPKLWSLRIWKAQSKASFSD